MGDNNDNKRQDGYADELDVYQAAWVVGKQRGIEMPLSAEPLAQLIEAGRLKWEVLSGDEKRMIRDNGGIKIRLDRLEKVDKKVGGDEKKNLIYVANLVVRELLQYIPEDFSRKISIDKWKELTKRQDKELREMLFKIKYGYFPDFYLYKVQQMLRGEAWLNN